MIAGHCVDIDGGLWHEPGRCPGTSANCDGNCCRALCDRCAGYGLIHDPNATTADQWNESVRCPECDGTGVAA